MKNIIVTLSAVALLVFSTGCSEKSGDMQESVSSDNGYPSLKLKISTVTSQTSIDTMTAQKFSELVKEASGGQINIRVFPNAQLAGGNQPKSIELLLAGGNYELAVFSGSVLGNIDEKFLTHQVPFLFSSYQKASEFLDGTGGAYYKKLMATKGLEYLGGEHNGLRQLTTKDKVIKNPSDLKGLKIRVPSGEVHMKTMSAFGADAVAMNWGEVFTALQQGTIDGHENGYQTILSANIQEVQKNITEWNWSYDGYWLVANANAFSKFDKKTQDLLKEKGVEATLWGRKSLENKEKEIKERFIGKDGVTVTELTAEELNEFKKVARPVQEYFIKKFGKEATTAWGLK